MATTTAAEINPAASAHLPFFITAPGETDVLFNIMAVVVLLMIVLIGVFYFRIHALPEHMASRMTKIQYELVAVLALISLFTHNHAFWIAGFLRRLFHNALSLVGRSRWFGAWRLRISHAVE